MRCLAVERVTQAVELLQASLRGSDFEQRSVLVITQAPENLIRRRMQINDLATPVQIVAIDLTQNCTAACSQDAPDILRQAVNHVLLKITKSLFTFAIKKFTN